MECYWSEGAESKLCGWLLQLSSNTLFAQSGHMVRNKRRVALQGSYSDWLQVLSGVPQGSKLGPLMFLVYIDDIPQCITHDSKVAIFADDSKLCKIIEKPSDKFSLQQDLIQLSIGHFRVLLCPCFKTSLSAKSFIWKWVLHAVSFSCKSKSFS